MKTPCEIIVWQILPAIRKKLTKDLIENHGFTQKKVANKLGTTEATVSRYLSGKRGKVEILDDKIMNEIKKSANRISKEDGIVVIEETCRICNLLKSTNYVKGINYTCK